MTGYKRIFLTFGDGSYGYRVASHRLAAVARSTRIFSRIERFDLMLLRRRYPDLWQAHREFILDRKNRRGLGYWLWKPLLIGRVLEEMDDGEVLIYCDAGCELNINFSATIEEILPGEVEDAVLFDGRVDENTLWTMQNWTNRYTIAALNVNDETLKCPQIVATVIILKANHKTRSFVNRWIEWVTKDNYGCLIDRDRLGEPEEFKEHRHDQAILSILSYQAMAENTLQLRTLPASYIERCPDFFIRAFRNRGGANWLPHPNRTTTMRLRSVYRRAMTTLWRKFSVDQFYLRLLSKI